MLIHSLIMPLFLYGIELYCGTFGYNMKKLSVLFNRVIRYLFCLRRYDRTHMTPYVFKFLGCSFLNYIKTRNILYFYKIVHNNELIYLNSFFSFSRSRRNRQIQIPRLTSLLERSFHVRVARIFNYLPTELKSLDLSFHTFKSKILTYAQDNEL